MQILRGTKREITIMQWEEQLKRAKKRLEDSRKCYELFGGEDDKQRVVEDEQRVSEIEQKMKKAIDFMEEHGIK